MSCKNGTCGGMAPQTGTCARMHAATSVQILTAGLYMSCVFICSVLYMFCSVYMSFYVMCLYMFCIYVLICHVSLYVLYICLYM